MKKILASILLLAIAASPMVASANADTVRQGGIESVAENVASVTTSHGEMTITNPNEKSMKFYIFSITGQMIKSIEIGGGDHMIIELPNGCYIVKCDQWSKKIIVK